MSVKTLFSAMFFSNFCVFLFSNNRNNPEVDNHSPHFLFSLELTFLDRNIIITLMIYYQWLLCH